MYWFIFFIFNPSCVHPTGMIFGGCSWYLYYHQTPNSHICRLLCFLEKLSTILTQQSTFTCSQQVFIFPSQMDETYTIQSYALCRKLSMRLPFRFLVLLTCLSLMDIDSTLYMSQFFFMVQTLCQSKDCYCTCK